MAKKKVASFRLAGRTEELGPFSSKKGNTLAWRIQPPRNVFSDRGSADCGPSRTGGSVHFAAKLGKHCAFREKGMDEDEVGKKRKKKKKPRLSSMLHCRILSLSASSQLTIFIVNSLPSENAREMPICSPPPTLQELLLHNQRMKTFAIQRPSRDAPL